MHGDDRRIQTGGYRVIDNENETGIDVRKENPFSLGGGAGGINANTDRVRLRCKVTIDVNNESFFNKLADLFYEKGLKTRESAEDWANHVVNIVIDNGEPELE